MPQKRTFFTSFKKIKMSFAVLYTVLEHVKCLLSEEMCTECKIFVIKVAKYKHSSYLISIQNTKSPFEKL
jgi:hypothetical protein